MTGRTPSAWWRAGSGNTSMSRPASGQADGRKPEGVHEPAPLLSRRLIITCLIAYGVDTFVTGIPGFGLLYCTAFVFIGTFSSVNNLLQSRRSIAAQRAIHTIVYAVVATAIMGTFLLDHWAGRSTAGTIASAARAYKVDHGSYPHDLDALIPRYLYTIPRPSFRLLYTDYDYWYFDDSDPMLIWLTAPPFGHAILHIETGKYYDTD